MKAKTPANTRNGSNGSQPTAQNHNWSNYNYQAHNTQRTQQPFDDGDDERTPITQQMGDFADDAIGFVFNPNIIKFCIMMFAGFCIFLNLAGYCDQITELFGINHIDSQLLSFLFRLPVIGQLFEWVNSLVGNLVVLVAAVAIWGLVQGLEILARSHWYFEDTATNVVFKLNKKRLPQMVQGSALPKRIYKIAVNEHRTLLRNMAIVGILAYVFDAYAMHLVRPWFDEMGNPIWLNASWNFLAVAGVELALLAYKGYRLITLNDSERQEKERAGY